MNRYLLAGLALIMALSLPGQALASCAAKPSVKDAAQGASVVFVGRVTKIVRARVAGASYTVLEEKPKWQKKFDDVDLVTFSVSEAFKGVSGATIDIATSADGAAGYRLEGGTWLKEGQTYLVYAYRRWEAGTIPDDLTKKNYGAVAADLRAIHKAFPKELATEINEFNSKLSPYDATICGRTTHISNAARELGQLRKLFPKAKRFDTRAAARQLAYPDAPTAFLASFVLESMPECSSLPALWF